MKLLRWPHLRSLDLGGDGFNNSTIEFVNRLQLLEQLAIRQTKCTAIKLHGLCNVRVIVVSTATEDRHRFLFPPWPVVRLSDLPRVEEIALEGITFDDALVSDLCKLPGLRHRQYSVQ